MASTIKVDNVQNQPGTNIVSKCGTDVTIGASGDTIALACGASQTGFGRTGTVDWQTAIQTSTPFTAATGKGYFINSTAGAITMNLPTSPSVGDIVAAKDYANTFDTNNLTIGRGGSNIGGAAKDSIVAEEGVAVTLVYADATKGWLVVNSGLQSEAPGPLFVVATGGTPCSGTIVCTNYKQHTFTGPGTFCVSAAGNTAGANTVDYLVVAGGGSGGNGPSAANKGGGGGGGGYRESPGTASGCYAVSPLGVGPAAAIEVSVTPYAIVVGGGGAGVGPPSAFGTKGNDSSFSTITSTGGGAGGSMFGCCGTGFDGGSGSGGGGGGSSTGGSGNTPPTTPAQGTAGGNGAAPQAGGAGGGATGVGAAGNPDTTGGTGGVGATSSISGSPVSRSGGGAGNGAIDGAGSPCGSGVGPGCTAAVNRGGGGGGSHVPYCTANAGSGVVIVRYKFQ